VGCERRKNGVKGFPTGWRGRGSYRRMRRRKYIGSARSGGRRSTHRADAGSTAQWSQILTSSTLGIEDLGPWTNDGLGQAGEERVMAGGRMGEWELLL
jgi:hypothetical protein